MRVNYRLDRVDFRPERMDFRPGILGLRGLILGLRGQILGATGLSGGKNEQNNKGMKVPLCSTGLVPFGAAAQKLNCRLKFPRELHPVKTLQVKKYLNNQLSMA